MPYIDIDNKLKGFDRLSSSNPETSLPKFTRAKIIEKIKISDKQTKKKHLELTFQDVKSIELLSLFFIQHITGNHKT